MPRPRSRTRFNFVAERPPLRLTARAVPVVDSWVAGEMFVSPHIEERRRGFAILLGTETSRRSPLTLQLLTGRIDEPDLNLRAQIVQALADYFEIRGREYRYPAEVRAAVIGHLRKFERKHILALLELWRAGQEGVVRFRAESLPQLIERIPDTSIHLTRIAADRSVTLELRRAAIEVVGQAGFVDALAALAALESRLEGRRAGQLALAFAPTDNPEEQKLLPALKDALRQLRECE